MKHPRSFVQRIFVEWLEMNRKRFIFPPQITHRTDRYLELVFVGLTPMLKCVLVRDGGLSVAVEHAGECWDLLADIGLHESRSQCGYANELYSPEACQHYPDRRLLWEGEVFQPFLEWCNTRLAQANWLVLYGEPDRTTWAELSTENNPAGLCHPIYGEN